MMNNKKFKISNFFMMFILLVVGIKHAINLLNFELAPISSALTSDIIFIFSMLIFILLVTMLIFYCPILIIIKIDVQLNTYFPPLVNETPNFKTAYKSIYIAKEAVYLRFCVIRC